MTPSLEARYGSGILMPHGAPIDSLLDILELIERIERQIGALTREAFLQDAGVQDATAYRLLAIGEAAKDLDDDLKSRHPHESEIIWETLKAELPELAAACRAELARLGSAPQ